MLHELKTLVGSAVMAADGQIGRIRSFLFNDRSWLVGYLVLDVGGWLDRRDVVVTIASLEEPDWEKRTFQVRLTREQVRESPGVDTEKPVTRQQEIAMREYWGRLACWVDSEFGFSTLPPGVKYPVHTEEDPDLRSTSDLLGYEVWAADGQIGWLDGFVIDEACWHLGYLDVRAGSWLQDRSVLIPTRSVSSISWAERRVYLHHTRQE